MLHQTIPLYDGNQPYIYACYSAEDDALAFPILARMYNEGFRIWSARAGGVEPDFRAMQRMNSSAYIIMFLSSSLLERLRTGDTELAAAARSALLRVTVMLDDSEVNNKIFALSIPDRVEYKPGNDAAFWLYIYSSDQLERCRGPWPEKKLTLRDPSYNDIAAESFDDEYRHLESIMNGRYTKTIEPALSVTHNFLSPADELLALDDGLTYAPIGKVKAVKTDLDKDFDAVVDMIDQFVVQQTALIEDRSDDIQPEDILYKPSAAAQAALDRTKELTTASLQKNASGSTVSDWSAEWVDDTAKLAPSMPPELVIDPFPTGGERYDAHPIGPKADVIITPIDATSDDNATAQSSDVAPTPQLTPGAELSAAVAAVTHANKPCVDFEENSQPEDAGDSPSEATFDQPEETAIIADVDTDDADTLTTTEPAAEAGHAEPAGFSVVPVMVRRQQSVHVVPVSVTVATPSAELVPVMHRVSAQKLASRKVVSRSRLPSKSAEVRVLPSTINSPNDFEKYVREIALDALNREQPVLEETATARKHRGKSVTVVLPNPPSASTATTAAQVCSPVSDCGTDTRSTPRKNRHPHSQDGLFATLLNKLRRERIITDQPAADIGKTQLVEKDAAIYSWTPTAAEPPHTETSAVENTRHEVDPTLFSSLAQQSKNTSGRHSGCSSLRCAVENFVEKDASTPVTVIVRRV